MSERKPDVVSVSPSTLAPAVGYSHALIVSAGKLAFISGQVGVDSEWRLAVGIEAQTELAFKNLSAVLAACDASLADIVKLTVFIRDAADHDIYCRVRDRFFDGIAPSPASSFIQVAGLYSPDALIEIEAVASLKQGTELAPAK